MDLNRGFVGRGRIRRSAAESGLYESRRLAAGGMHLEEVYQAMETAAAPVFARFLRGDYSLSPQERANVAEFLAHQATRVPAYRRTVRDSIIEGALEIIRHELETDPDVPAEVREYFDGPYSLEVDPDEVTRRTLTDASDKYQPVLIPMEWFIVRAPEGSEFIIADQCVRWMSFDDPDWGRLARDSTGLAVLTPLSPRCLVWLTGRPVDGLVETTISAFTTTAASVEAFNTLSLIGAHDYVYAASRDVAEWACQNRHDLGLVHVPGGVIPVMRPRTTDQQ